MELAVAVGARNETRFDLFHHQLAILVAIHHLERVFIPLICMGFIIVKLLLNDLFHGRHELLLKGALVQPMVVMDPGSLLCLNGAPGIVGQLIYVVLEEKYAFLLREDAILIFIC